jgi:3-hydroxybutyryl-CoA dehydrogenase
VASVADKVSVIGAGTMGVGIAHAFAVADFDTVVVEPRSSQVTWARDQVDRVLTDGIRRGKVSEEGAADVVRRLTYVDAVEDVPAGCRIIVESVPERFELKTDVLRRAEQREPDVLATNTSALSVEELGATLERPEAFLGTHFFNPVWALHLVEIVTTAATSEQTLAATRELVVELGKQAAVVCDSPGFATSRLDLVTALEAMRMVEQGVASAEDIDRAVTLAYRHPVGPLRLSDIVGLDVRLDTALHLVGALGPGFAPPQILVDLVEAGHLGEKTGQGFYSWG